MAKKDLEAGLETSTTVDEQKTMRRRRQQTQEDVEVINAGVEKLIELGISEKAATILKNLAPVWNGSDKEVLSTAKATVINAFGGSDSLKDYIDTEAKNELMAFAGIAKIMPIFNNICSFYARRTSTKKNATCQVNIGGTLYNVNKEFYMSLSDKSKEEKRELLLAHESTVKAGDIPEML